MTRIAVRFLPAVEMTVSGIIVAPPTPSPARNPYRPFLAVISAAPWSVSDVT